MKKISYYAYSRALQELRDKIDSRIFITDLGSSADHPEIDMGVNWSSIGAIQTEEAVSFAQALTEAAKAARDFPYNGYQIDY